MTKLTQDQIEALQEEITAWMNDNKRAAKRSVDEKWAICYGIFILLYILGIDDDRVQQALDEVL